MNELFIPFERISWSRYLKHICAVAKVYLLRQDLYAEYIRFVDDNTAPDSHVITLLRTPDRGDHGLDLGQIDGQHEINASYKVDSRIIVFCFEICNLGKVYDQELVATVDMDFVHADKDLVLLQN